MVYLDWPLENRTGEAPSGEQVSCLAISRAVRASFPWKCSEEVFPQTRMLSHGGRAWRCAQGHARKVALFRCQENVLRGKPGGGPGALMRIGCSLMGPRNVPFRLSQCGSSACGLLLTALLDARVLLRLYDTYSWIGGMVRLRARCLAGSPPCQWPKRSAQS